MKYRPSPVAWLERAGVKLTSVGADRYRLPCPVHGGGPGSMGLSKVDGVWVANCFACGFAGDAISLVMATASIPFPAALAELDCKPSDRHAPVEMHRRPFVVVSCDVPGCGSRIEAEGKTYKIPGMAGLTWTTTADVEALFRAELAGWWIGNDGQVAICVEHIAPQQDSGRRERQHGGRVSPPVDAGTRTSASRPSGREPYPSTAEGRGRRVGTGRDGRASGEREPRAACLPL